jgi:hypothetical protein
MSFDQDQQANSLQLDATRKSFNNQLTDQLESIKRWHRLSTYNKIYAINDFMNAIGQLYMDYFQYHLDEAQACASFYHVIFKQEFMNIMRDYVYRFFFKLKSADEWDDPWVVACRVRTNIEAFNSMFGGISPENIPTEEFEQYLDERRDGYHLSQDEIPKNAPRSHWWWFVNDF